MPIDVQGPGLIDCHVYTQPGRTIVHLVNLTSEATWRAPLDELIRVGPFTVTVRSPEKPARRCRLLVAEVERPLRSAPRSASVQIDSILDHEVLVFD
jgi:hypothetical protein